MAVVALAAVLRFHGLGASSLWFDELVTTQVIDYKSHLLPAVARLEGAPPLYFMLLVLWREVFGGGDAALRALSAVAGTATVPVAYAIGRELTGRRRVAQLAALLVAVNPMLVWFSQELRAYSLVSFLSSVSLLFCVRSVARKRTPDVVWWGVFSAAAIATHYFAVFLIAAEVVWLFLALRPEWRKLLLGAIPLAVTLPLIYVPFFRVQRGENLQAWVQDTPMGFRYAEAARQALMGPGGWDDRLWLVAAVCVGIAVALIVLRADRRERRAASILGLLAATGVVLPLVAAAIGNDYFLGRNAISLLVPVAVVVAIGLGTRRAGWVGAAATLGLCAVSVGVVAAVASQDELQKADWRGLAGLLDRGPSDRLVVIEHDGHLGMPLLRYFDNARVLNPGEVVRVPEIDLVYHFPDEGRCGLYQGRDCDPASFLFPRFPDRLANDYLYTEKPSLGNFAVNRYVARRVLDGDRGRPPPVRVRDLEESPPQKTMVVLYVDRGGG